MEKNSDFLEKLVHINRITKVVKGGRRFGFSALVVVGNQNGKIGVAHAKAKQVPDAIKKANELARRKLIQIPLREGRTIHHDIYGKDGAGKIKLRAAPKGTGIIAGGPVRAVCEVLGIKDIVAKSIGTANPHNVIRACMKALQKQNSPKNISILRNKKITEIIEKRGFNPIKKDKIAIINLGKIQSLLDAKRINSDTKIDLDLLKKANIVGKSYKKIKILGSGEIKNKIDVNVDFFSKSAQKKLEKIGGSINLKKKI